MKKKTIKLEIEREDDRRELVAILAENGYEVSVQEKEIGYYKYKYYVIIHLSERKEEEWERELYRIIDVYRSLHASVLKASVRDFISTLLAQREKEIIEKLHKSMKDNLGIMFATPSDPYHINTKAYIKCCKWWEDTIYKTIDNLESTLSEAGEKREEVRE